MAEGRTIERTIGIASVLLLGFVFNILFTIIWGAMDVDVAEHLLENLDATETQLGGVNEQILNVTNTTGYYTDEQKSILNVNEGGGDSFWESSLNILEGIDTLGELVFMVLGGFFAVTYAVYATTSSFLAKLIINCLILPVSFLYFRAMLIAFAGKSRIG